jgi:hypothetical protein
MTAIVQSNQHTEISYESPNLFSATEIAATIGADLKTINEWLEVGAIDRAVFGGGGFSKNELQRAALIFELVKLGLTPTIARDVIREIEDDLQQIWSKAVPNNYEAYAIVILNKRKQNLVFWCWKASKEKIPPPAQDQIILSITDILARLTDQTKQPRPI